MKTKFRKVTAAAVLASVAAALMQGTAFADLPPGAAFATGVQAQNVGTANATIVLTGYDSAGTQTFTDSTTGASVAAGASVNYVNFPAAATTFKGAGILSSDQPLVAIVNINNATAGGFAAGQYQGTDSSKTGTSIGFPLVKNNFNGKCTTFFVQNAGTAAAVINATFSNGSTFSSSAAVDPGDMITIDPAAATPAVPGTSPFALTVSSAQPLAGTVAEHNCTNADILQATRGFGPSDGGTTLFAPIYKNAFGSASAGSRSNGIQAQNVSSGPVDITVTYAHAPLSGCQPSCAAFSQTQVGVPAGASVTFFKNNIIAAAGGGATSSTGTPLPAGSLAAATITSSGNVVAIVNESFDALPAGVTRQAATTYSAQASSAAGTKLALPLVKELQGNNNKTTGVQIQNTGSANATVKVTYNMNAGAATCQGTFTLDGITVAPGASVTLFRLSGSAAPSGSTWAGGNTIKAGCFGGALIESTNGQPLVAIANESDTVNSASKQDNKTYEAFKIN
jgi:hypothetical protein